MQSGNREISGLMNMLEYKEGLYQPRVFSLGVFTKRGIKVIIQNDRILTVKEIICFEFC